MGKEVRVNRLLMMSLLKYNPKSPIYLLFIMVTTQDVAKLWKNDKGFKDKRTVPGFFFFNCRNLQPEPVCSQGNMDSVN